MTRTRAILWGAIYGGLIGPALGGLLFALAVMVRSERPRSISDLLYGIALISLMGIWMFGLYGLPFGVVGAIALREFFQRRPASFATWLMVPVYGALIGFLAMETYNVVRVHQSPLQVSPLGAFLVLGVVASAASFSLLGWQLLRAQRRETTLESS